jgi:hypothetical protein
MIVAGSHFREFSDTFLVLQRNFSGRRFVCRAATGAVLQIWKRVAREIPEFRIRVGLTQRETVDGD